MKKDGVITWIREYFKGNDSLKAVIGISGGTDSSVAAALLCEALGKDRIVGVLMPNGEQHDIDVSKKLVEYLGIKHYTVNIHEPVSALHDLIADVTGVEPNDTDAYKTNTPARIRMTVLYGICALEGGRVANTCNLSEDYVGYSTKFGDAAGDFSILSSFSTPHKTTG